ncbi:hypothetical protein L596_022054 [Steinernema carpocapsae]|uniref:Uncharacterized protein n=1 Tax=Steinernema carpocapsae TaxID=34508 RepID=A0A4U5MKN8_STECR|nr:hypothetical protein L596_022054 [Steinernema carpocapsae]
MRCSALKCGLSLSFRVTFEASISVRRSSKLSPILTTSRRCFGNLHGTKFKYAIGWRIHHTDDRLLLYSHLRRSNIREGHQIRSTKRRLNEVRQLGLRSRTAASSSVLRCCSIP